MIPKRFKEAAEKVRENANISARRTMLPIVALLVLASGVPLGVAPPGTENVSAAHGVVIDDFEDGNYDEWSTSTSGYSVTSTSEDVYGGSFAFEAPTGNHFADLNFADSDYSSMSWAWRVDSLTAGSRRFSVSGDGGTAFEIEIDSGSFAPGAIVVHNGSSFHDTGIRVDASQYYLFEVSNINYADDTATLTVYNNGTVVGTDEIQMANDHTQLTDLRWDTKGVEWLDSIGVNGFNAGGELSVSGTVTDQDDEPISNVTVEISDSTSGDMIVTTTTEGDGEFATQLPNGSYVANFSKIGYSDAQETFTVAGERVTVDAQLVEQRLRLEGRKLFQPGSTHDYRVIFETADESGNLDGVDVTDSATVTSLNTSILTVNEAQATMTAVDDENVSQVVTVNMSYQSYSGQAKIVVAEATVDNLAILPTGLTRAQAVMLDDFIFALLIAAFLSVPASRFANAFAGLGVAEMVIVVGWLGGFVPLGIAMLSIFMAMFVGLNLAANIDYTMRR